MPLSVEHATVRANGASFHVASLGEGKPLLLLHGWPEFWLTWEPVMDRLAGRYRLIAPDLRGFGDSDKPAELHGAADHATDLLALLDALGMARVGVVGHDIGGAVMQPMARMAPERMAGLFFFGFAHPAIGARAATPDRLNEIWYQSFHQLPMAPALVGATRETCRTYVGHFLRHWAHRKDVFDDVLEIWVDNFMKPGNLEGGFNYYRAAHQARIATMTGNAPRLAPITLPACVRWAEHDAIFPYRFTEGLDQIFTDLDLAPFPDVGHFAHREDPDRAASEIDAFYTRIGWC